MAGSLGSQVGSAHVAIFPTMSGFRSAVNKEVSATGKAATSTFSSAFRGAGQKSGAQLGRELKAAFQSSSTSMADQVLSTFRKDVASAQSAVTSARRKMEDDAGRLRVAEERLQEVRNSEKATASQVAAAEERVASAQRRCEASSASYNAATERLTSAQESLKRAQDEVAKASSKSSNAFSRLAGKVTSSVGSALSGLSSKVTDAGRSAFSKLPNVVQSGVRTAFSGVGGIASGALGGLRSAASSACDGVKGAMSRMASGVGSAMSSMAKAAAVGAAALGAAFAVTGKQALDAYASWEQLVGGVDTLFGDASAQVQQYAANAYRTAGMSANTYMETVTGFSATLLQGLGGDTAKAAEIADMAVTDMSDNANKMGTSIDSIRDAYQGFAKQNYDMLDNLKLGYGGTASEMARLINDSGVLGDAMEVTAETVKDVPFDKMVEAIHQVQTEMGITGTTSKEASSTIEGSVNSAKAAWENWLAEMGKTNADMTTATNQLVDSVTVAASNVVPRTLTIVRNLGSTIVSNAVKWLSSELPPLLQRYLSWVDSSLPKVIASGADMLESVARGIVNNLPQITTAAVRTLTTLCDGLSNQMPRLVPLAVQMVANVVGGIVDSLPRITDSAVRLLTTLINGLSSQMPKLVPLAAQMVVNLVTGIVNNLPQIIDSGIRLVTSLVQGIVNSIPTLVAQAPSMIGQLASTIISNLPTIINAGVNIIGSLVSGLVSAVPSLIGQIPGIASQIVSSFANTDWGSIGSNIVSGIWNGISGMAGWLWGKVSGWAGGLLNDVKGALGIASPSKVFAREVGRWIPAGVGVGIDQGEPSLLRKARGMTGDLVREVEGTVASVGVDLEGAGRGASARGALSVTQNFYQPVQRPDEFARTMRMQARYGIAAQVA